MAMRSAKTNKLTDTQLVLLSSASQRQDRFLIRSETMTERAFARAVNGLVKQGLVVAVDSGPVGADPLGDADKAPTVAITLAGLTAIGCSQSTEDTHASTETGRSKAGQPVVAPPAEVATGKGEPTKRALIIAMLSREEGASLNDLTGATGWLPHTTRAALTGLRQKGFGIERTQRADRTSVYRIVAVAAHEQAA
jgi:hypothetical protein